MRVRVTLPADTAARVDWLADTYRSTRSKIVADLLMENLYAKLAEGYEYYAEENSRFAEEGLPLAAEVWDDYPGVDWDAFLAKRRPTH